MCFILCLEHKHSLNIHFIQNINSIYFTKIKKRRKVRPLPPIPTSFCVTHSPSNPGSWILHSISPPSHSGLVLSSISKVSCISSLSLLAPHYPYLSDTSGHSIAVTFQPFHHSPPATLCIIQLGPHRPGSPSTWPQPELLFLLSLPVEVLPFLKLISSIKTFLTSQIGCGIFCLWICLDFSSYAVLLLHVLQLYKSFPSPPCQLVRFLRVCSVPHLGEEVKQWLINSMGFTFKMSGFKFWLCYLLAEWNLGAYTPCTSFLHLYICCV